MAKATKREALSRGLSALLKDTLTEDELRINKIAELEHQLKLKDIDIKYLKSINKSLEEINKDLYESNERIMRISGTQMDTISNLVNANFVETTVKARNTDWSNKDKK